MEGLLGQSAADLVHAHRAFFWFWYVLLKL